VADTENKALSSYRSEANKSQAIVNNVDIIDKHVIQELLQDSIKRRGMGSM
jgi:hypothetical protein